MKNVKELSIEIDINVSKERAWDVLFNRFGEVNNFNPHLVGSHHTKGVQGEVGCERQCDMDAKNSVQERIVSVRGNESFEIDIYDGKLPMMNEMKVQIDVNAINANETNVVFTTKFVPTYAIMAPLMRVMLNKMFKKLLVGLKYHLETDKLVTKSNIDGIMKGFRRLDKREAFVAKQLAYA